VSALGWQPIVLTGSRIEIIMSYFTAIALAKLTGRWQAHPQSRIPKTPLGVIYQPDLGAHLRRFFAQQRLDP